MRELLERLVVAVERIAEAVERSAGPKQKQRRRGVRRARKEQLIPTDIDKAAAGRALRRRGLVPNDKT